MCKDIENPMVVDAYWPEYDEEKRQKDYEAWLRKCDEEHDLMVERDLIERANKVIK